VFVCNSTCGQGHPKGRHRQYVFTYASQTSRTMVSPALEVLGVIIGRAVADGWCLTDVEGLS
jgi:hypothetical protein